MQVFGEIAHFLIATTSKDVAGDIHYGDQVELWFQIWKREYFDSGLPGKGEQLRLFNLQGSHTK